MSRKGAVVTGNLCRGNFGCRRGVEALIEGRGREQSKLESIQG